jgi:hypothetical protein
MPPPRAPSVGHSRAAVQSAARRRQQEQADLSRKPSLGEWVGGLVRGFIDRPRVG